MTPTLTMYSVYLVASCIHEIVCQTTTEPGDDDDNEPQDNTGNDVVPKSLITIGLLGVAVLIGVLIAKLTDYCHDRRALRDDASDMSEYTRNLLKQKFMIAFRSTKDDDVEDGPKQTPEESAKKFGKVWKENAATKKLQKEADESGDKDVSITIPDSNDQKAPTTEKIKKPDETKVTVEADPKKTTKKTGASQVAPIEPATKATKPKVTAVPRLETVKDDEEDDEFEFTPQKVTKPATSNKTNETITKSGKAAKDLSDTSRSDQAASASGGKSPRPITSRPISAMSRHGITQGGREVQRQSSVNSQTKKK